MSDHDRKWIIGCIKHDGFIKTGRFDKANHIILEALSDDAVPHGRLIDADALIFELEEWKKNPNNDDSAVDLVNHFIGIIRATPSAEQVTSKLKKPCDSLLTDDSAECKEQKSKLDVIRRQDAIQAALDCFSENQEVDRPKIEQFINALPSADVPAKVIAEIKVDTEEVIERIKEEHEIRPKGHWIKKRQECEYRCDQCGKIVFADDENELKFCCCCGADMRGDSDDE